MVDKSSDPSCSSISTGNAQSLLESSENSRLLKDYVGLGCGKYILGYSNLTNNFKLCWRLAI